VNDDDIRPLHKLQLWLMQHRISQAKFAKRLGLKDRSFLSLMFTGRWLCPADLAARIERETAGGVKARYCREFRVPGVNPTDR
jgi:DNA-binding transcriptional regulator YdaS (Cro superfamily)